MSTFSDFLDIGWSLKLEGQALITLATERDKIQRDEQATEREAQKSCDLASKELAKAEAVRL